MPYKEEIERGVELLKLCQTLQSEKDGIDRPELHVIDKTKTLDQFARDISKSATWMSSLYKLVPMMDDLAKLGRKLESEGRISVDYGEDYSEAALNYLLEQNGLRASPK